MDLNSLRQKIRENVHVDEHQLVASLLSNPVLTDEQRQSAVIFARKIVEESRRDKPEQSPLDSFLLEFGLSNKEGVALMCLAESLLRVPDAVSADRLIAEKVQSGDWIRHVGHSDSLFVNSSTWGLLLTGKVVQLDSDIRSEPGSWISRLKARAGEPLIRAAFVRAMKLMGQHFVLGRDIEEGLDNGFGANTSSYSFDMLGEAARTEKDAQRYYQSYSNAIDEIGEDNDRQDDVYAANGISVKLSALHPRYEFSQRDRVISELLPRITELCKQARHYNLGLSIDAEEAARLDLSLDIFNALAHNPDLEGWEGLGFVLQAYQKRAPLVAQWLIELAKETDRRLMIRLVKGAYWDYEIKHAQEQGLQDYPVFTRKAHTDVCYLHCAKHLFESSGLIFPQFATHNAYTAAAVLQLAQNRKAPYDFEFQRLHGMGELLYKHLFAHEENQQLSLRVYAPIGKHEDLLPYLVRRLLENGANSSFVNRFLDNKTPVEELIQDLYEPVQQAEIYRHSSIPLPEDIYITAGEQRKNSTGIDLDSVLDAQPVVEALRGWRANGLEAGSIIGGDLKRGEEKQNFGPADSLSSIGSVASVSDQSVLEALERAQGEVESWRSVTVSERADILRRAATLLESSKLEFIRLIVAEAGRTIPDAQSEIREAIDFCHYYALQAERIFTPDSRLQGCGVFLCISPWNFPLAIFVGQIVAALVAGNTVIAKPAAQTPTIAVEAVRLLHKAGIPIHALHLLVGSGSQIGARLLPDPRVSGVCFTGSTDTARTIYRELAERPGGSVPLIAETGGQNCMIADSTALPEQLVDDVISSAFLSAGQRCSASRVLFVQEEIADSVIGMLKGSMRQLKIGDPADLETDIGPVIDLAARKDLEAHLEKMKKLGNRSFSLPIDERLEAGSYFSPHIIEIKSLDQLEREVFGPVLHVIRYRSGDLDDVIKQINDTEFGLTLGIHSRVQAFADYVISQTKVGNNYINRNMVGAVVGVNPFGGMGLSGTGPKAGGPNYLYGFCRLESKAALIDLPGVQLGSAKEVLSNLEDKVFIQSKEAFETISKLSPVERYEMVEKIFDHTEIWAGLSPQQLSSYTEATRRFSSLVNLPGPTGEENLLSMRGRGVVACLAVESGESEVSEMLALALVSGCATIVFAVDSVSEHVRQVSHHLKEFGFPSELVQVQPSSKAHAFLSCYRIDGVLIAGSKRHDLVELKQILADHDGPLVPIAEFPVGGGGLVGLDIGSLLINLMVEKTRTENLVAKGGNTQLFNIEE